jgi:hypothetical protein
VSKPPPTVPPSSFRLNVTVAVPLFPKAGVNVSAPTAETAGCTVNNAPLLLLKEKLNTWADSSDGPALIPLAQPVTARAPELNATVWSAPFTKLGASFTAPTVMLTLAGALTAPLLSVTVNSKLSGPAKFALGVYVTLGHAPVTVPFAGGVLTAYDAIVPSTSLPVSVIPFATSSTALTLCGVATGTLFPETTIVNV